MVDDELTAEIIDAAVAIHRRIGPGLLESVYEAMLSSSLARRGVRAERQRLLTFEEDGVRFREGLRVDLLVEARIVVELKSVEQLQPVHTKQLLTYLRVLELPVGLLLNFGAATLKSGLRRVVNKYIPPAQLSGRSPRLPVHLRDSARTHDT
jgi:iron complex transport system substrate-binding protein